MIEMFVAADCSQNCCIRYRVTNFDKLFTAIQKVKWPYNTRVLFVDFSKAFDVIDHNVLLNKFISNNIPEHIIVWSLDFLNGRKQFVKIGNSVSNTTVVVLHKVLYQVLMTSNLS